MSESDVVWPLGTRAAIGQTAKRKNEGLSKARIGFCWDELFHGDKMWELIKEELGARWPEATFIGPAEFPNFHDKFSDDVENAALQKSMLDLNITGAVVGVGACGSCTAATVRAASALEQVGIPAVSILGQAFEPMGRAIASSGPNPQQPFATYPGPEVILTDTEEEFRRKVREVIIPKVVEALDTQAVTESLAETTDIDDAELGLRAPTIVFSGDLDAIQDHFVEQGWSDGLPIVPPTPERVSRFLSHTKRDPHEVLGALLPERREATVWNVAVNGVMAGCRPEYMPILVAAVEALADPVFHVQDAGSTPGWEPLITVSGPVVEELNFNYAQGAMRIGRQANSSIGRFIRLYLRNVAGLRIPPGTTDGAGIGYTFNVALAESDGPASSAGWSTMREEMGYGRDQSIVFLQSVRSITGPIYSMGSTPDENLEALAEGATGTLRTSSHRAYVSGKQFTTIIMNSPVAKVLGDVGLGRDYVRQYLYDHCWIPVSMIDAWAERVGRSPNATSILEGAERIGITPENRDGQLSLPLFARPADIAIVVAGNPGRNQSRIYFDNGPQGGRIVRQVES